jgi:hypothetical protein
VKEPPGMPTTIPFKGEDKQKWQLITASSMN